MQLDSIASPTTSSVALVPAERAALVRQSDAPSPGESEAEKALCELAHGKTGDLPPELLARHVLVVTAGADWPVQRAALEALLRRLRFAERDELRVVGRPTGPAAPLGGYVTRGRGMGTRAEGRGARPYSTLLRSFDPPSGSCDCRDFLKSSLGLCKHLLVALADVASRPRQIERARARCVLPEARGNGLVFDPVRPLTGPGDWLERIRYRPAGAGALPQASRARVRRWLALDGASDWRLKEPPPVAPEDRLTLVRGLLELSKLQAGSDPAALALLGAEQGRLEAALARARALGDPARWLATLEQRLYPYQREGVLRFLGAGRLLLGDDMGLGKTAQAIASCHVLFRAGAVRRGLVLAPASLKAQWQREWHLFSDAPIAVVEGGAAERAALYRRHREGFLIANYEQLFRDLPAIQKWRPDMVVLDEAQRIKNWATKTAVHVKQLAPHYRLVLTGTPMENRLDELASIMEWVDDLALEPRWRLGPWHSTAVDGAREISGARNLDVLRTRLAPSFLRRLRKDVLAQLPTRTDTRVPVELTAEQLEEHRALDQPIAQLVARARRRPLSQPEFLRLMSLLSTQRVICNGLAQLRFEEVWPALEATPRPSESFLRGLSSPKLGELRELLGQVVLGQGRKVVVFSQWRRMLRLAHWAVSDLLASAGVRSVFFTGQEGLKRRTQNIVDLHDDPATRVLFATDAGGVGLNLQRAASCCINLELPWNPAVLEQRIGRIYRNGQKHPIEVYHLTSEQGIEVRLAALVSDKKALFHGLFDGTSDEVHFDRSGSFLARLETLIEPAVVPARQAEDADPGAAEEESPEQSALAEVAMEPAVAPELEPQRVALPTSELAALLSQLAIQPAADGGITIQAPRAAAAALGALFADLARKLGA